VEYVLALCPHLALLLGNAMAYTLGKNSLHQKHFHLTSQGESWCLLLKQVLVSACNDCLGDITEGKEVTDWTAVGSSVSDIKDFMEYVFNGP
jgi:hypothetical protein